MKTERRKQVHDLLDHFLNDLEAREGEALASDYPQTARELFKHAMGFASNLIPSGLREKIAPRIVGSDPQDLRLALIQTIDLLIAVWPQASRSVGFYSPETLWATDLIEAIGKLDVGETMPIFQPSKGLGKHEWTERRFRFLAVLWALHHERREIKELANNRVFRAFKPDVTDVLNKNGRFKEGQLPKWRRHIEAVAAGNARDDAVSSGLAVAGINFVQATSKDCDEEWLSLSLHHIAFGTTTEGATSLSAAGARYRTFVALRMDEPTAKAKRAQRTKVLIKRDNH